MLDELARYGPALAVGFALAALLAYLLTPVVRRAVLRAKLVDRPGGRRVNLRPIPRAGGLAVAASFLVVGGGAVVLQGLGIATVPLGTVGPDVPAILLGGALAAAIGFLDDVFQLRARWQLLGQIAVAVLAVALGVSVGFINNPVGGGPIRFPEWFAVGFTVFWIVGMINSINFIDGLDGLSSGIGVIAALTLAFFGLTGTLPLPFVALLGCVLAGALVGFLRWNFHPATIFAGTSGTMFLGYTLALLSIAGTAKVPLALLVLGVPILDTFWIIVRRLATGRAPFSPDRGHIHHRLLDLGLSHTQTVVLIYVLCAGLALLSTILSGTGQLYAFVGVGIAFGVVLFLLTRETAEDALEAESYEPSATAPAAPTAAGQPPTATEAAAPPPTPPSAGSGTSAIAPDPRSGRPRPFDATG